MAQEDMPVVDDAKAPVTETDSSLSLEPSLGAKSLSVLSDSADVSVADLASSAFGKGSDTMKSAIATEDKTTSGALPEAGSNGLHLPLGNAAQYDPSTGSYQKPSTGESFAVQPPGQEAAPLAKDEPVDNGGAWEVVTRRDSAHPPAQPADPAPAPEATSNSETTTPAAEAEPLEPIAPAAEAKPLTPITAAPEAEPSKPEQPPQVGATLPPEAAPVKSEGGLVKALEPPPPDEQSKLKDQALEPPPPDEQSKLKAESKLPEVACAEPAVETEETEKAGDASAPPIVELTIEPDVAVLDKPVKVTAVATAKPDEPAVATKQPDEQKAVVSSEPEAESVVPSTKAVPEAELPVPAGAPAASTAVAEKEVELPPGENDVLLASEELKDTLVKPDVEDGSVVERTTSKNIENGAPVDEEPADATEEEESCKGRKFFKLPDFKLPAPWPIVGGAAALAVSLIVGVCLLRGSKDKKQEEEKE